MTTPIRRRPGAESALKLVAEVEEVRTATTAKEQTPEAPKEQTPASLQTQPIDDTRAAAAAVPSIAPPVTSESRTAATYNIRISVKKSAETAVLRTGGLDGGYTSLNALVENAIERELQRLADKFNGGESFPANQGGFRRGRPIGS